MGETLYRVWREVEEGIISKSRRALFGDDFRETYDLLQNRFLFVEGGNDDHLFLEHYVLLGNFVNDPDRFDVFDHLLLDFVRDFVLADGDSEELSKARKTHERLMEQARLLRSELERIEEEQRELSARAGESVDGFPWPFKRKTSSSADVKAELAELRQKIFGARGKPRGTCATNRRGQAAPRLSYRGIPEPARRLSQPARKRAQTCSARKLPRGRERRLRIRAHNCSRNGCTGWRSATFCSTCSPATSCGKSTRNTARRFTCSS